MLYFLLAIQPDWGFEEINWWRVKDEEEERNGKAIDREQTKLPMAIGPAVLNSLPTNPSSKTTSATEETVQYAAVRKPLKKTHSLPECKCGTETAQEGLEVSRLQALSKKQNLFFSLSHSLHFEGQ